MKYAFILAVAGDVLVGWISSKSGKGGVDDYFLAGDIIKCDDGAESCPDRTKGGTKDIELLNAVSRANYTMLTIRRPVIAQGAFDVDVELKKPQNIFWSVGYKSAAMRKNNKPVKNVSPITLEFGRKPIWNCPEEDFKEVEPVKTRPVGVQETPDLPRRRISSPAILTPPIKNSTPRPGSGVVFRPVYTGPSRQNMPMPPPIATSPRPRVRTRPPVPTSIKATSDWFSPPTGPEINSGFSPGRSPMPKLIKDTLDSKHFVNKDWEMPNIGCSQTANGPLYVHLGPATASRGNQGLGTVHDLITIFDHKY